MEAISKGAAGRVDGALDCGPNPPCESIRFVVLLVQRSRAGMGPSDHFSARQFSQEAGGRAEIVWFRSVSLIVSLRTPTYAVHVRQLAPR